MSKASDLENQFDRRPTSSNFALIGHAPSSGPTKKQRIVRYTLITVLAMLLLASIGLISTSLWRRNAGPGDGEHAIEIHQVEPVTNEETLDYRIVGEYLPYATGTVIRITDDIGHIYRAIYMNNGHVRFNEKDFIYDPAESSIYAEDGDLKFRVIDHPKK